MSGDLGSPATIEPKTSDPDDVDAFDSQGNMSGDLSLQLRRLRDALERAQRQEKEAEGKVQRINTQIAALSPLSDEIDKIVESYAIAFKGLKATDDSFKEFQQVYIANLKKVLDPDALDKIKKVVQPLRAEIDELEDDESNPHSVAHEAATLARLKDSLARAGESRDIAKDIYEKSKKLVASIGGRHGELKALRDQIAKLASDGELAFALWRLTAPDQFTKKLKEEIQIIEVKDARERIVLIWNTYNRAIKRVEELEGRVKGSEEALKTMKARLADAKKTFDARVRTGLAVIKPPPGNQSEAPQQFNDPGSEE